ncbi:CDP-diacylglycerol--glycerol-3-phosphate 3-phosphatidyltransferase [Halioglobus japonicus]|uniref:CDP-diacylglycerol--glycerol-3-phosphate 3-phosphatidyltransferase n=1 Tax=Halioglobus japonicus TaxID=930805 RepID=A0AAP8SNN1_9GAMM|nr:MULTISPECIES: CDP-diacylglycerol--glycerol-3-phosphate 3-phosphatidyltransferase [Halioglobus]AQA18773.1 CDP-diacylglycerol--glycerol-3-phosphate 3-phosphatidyltransferase [Halioglobus japonicus]KZX60233.1 CDP-diacylglycerol--glycerol-3-phosphate 3-phosphatidyltransferase [Halioglobus sp. HI00S01]PLW86805.1 CDP-diacylglycerol--glycerol-3-phosphate 3-phosphatidyltransferase [Halioglobus japonicus]GHD10978.1 CDP-diacylglycerol--glycerol-3-phosphate 3-phosphatidyltransferase [Halioglobus japoni
MKLNIPNALTLLRICLIPVLVVVFYLPFNNHLLVAAVIFAVAAITDWVDGYLARRLGQTTAFGAFLDPVADKLMVAVALVLLVERHDTLLFTLAACVIIGREIVVSALREWMAELGARTSVAVSYVGKVKTAFQMVAITALLAINPQTNESWLLALSYVVLYIAAILTLWSMFIYLKAAWIVMKERDNSF